MNGFNINPVFNKVGRADFSVATRATVGGVSLKTGLFLITTIIFACLGFFALPGIINGDNSVAYIMLSVSSICTFITAFLCVFIPSTCKVCGFLFSASEGYTIGVLSALMSILLPGTYIVELSLLLTVCIFVGMYLLYQIPAVRNSRGLRHFLLISSVIIMFAILFSVIFSLFGINMFDNFFISLGVSIFLAIYASLSLIMNFDQAYAVVGLGCPKEAEWQVAFGFTLSIIYIYIQVLQLLYILFSNYSNN